MDLNKYLSRMNFESRQKEYSDSKNLKRLNLKTEIMSKEQTECTFKPDIKVSSRRISSNSKKRQLNQFLKDQEISLENKSQKELKFVPQIDSVSSQLVSLTRREEFNKSVYERLFNIPKKTYVDVKPQENYKHRRARSEAKLVQDRLYEDAFLRNLKLKRIQELQINDENKRKKNTSKGTNKYSLERLSKPLLAKEIVNYGDLGLTFQPEICNKSKFIAMKVRMDSSHSSKNQNESNTQCELYSRCIIQKKTSQLEIQKAKNIIEEEISKECTFRPAINKRKRSNANKSLFSDTGRMFDRYIKNFKHDGEKILTFQNNQFQNNRNVKSSSVERRKDNKSKFDKENKQFKGASRK